MKSLKLPAGVPTPFGRALKNVGWLLTGKGLGGVLSVVYLALATRSLGIHGFGQFTLILSTGQAAAAFVAFQTWQIVVRFGMAHLEHGRTAALGRLVRFSAVLDFGAALVGCALAVGALAVMRWHFGWSDTLWHEAVAFCFVLLLSVRSTAVGILRLHDRFAVGAAADAVTPICRFIGASLAVWLHAGVVGFLIAWAVSEIATALVYWIGAVRTAPGLMRGWQGTLQAPGENPGLWHFAFATNLNSSLKASSRQFVVLLVGFLTGPAAAGAYRLAYQLSQSLVLLSDMFSRAVLPEVTRADAQPERDSFVMLVRQSARLAVGVGLVTCVLVPILGLPVLYLIAGKTYLGAYPILVLLGLAAGLDIMTVGFEPVLLGTGRAARALHIRIASAVALFAGVAVLMPYFGLAGSGFATLFASLLALALFVRSALEPGPLRASVP